MDDDDTNIFQRSIHEKYAARPATIENLPLIEFVSAYKYSSSLVKEKVQSSADDDETCLEDEVKKEVKHPKQLVLRNDLGYMRLRKTPAIVRTHNVKQGKDSELYHYKLLLLYVPWRKEDELLGSFHSFEESYEQKKEEMQPWIEKFQPNASEIEPIIDSALAIEDEAPEDITPATIDDENDAHVGSDAYPENIDSSINDHDIGLDMHCSKAVPSNILPTDEISNAEYYSLVRSLNVEQRNLFEYISLWCRECLEDETPIAPFHIFLTGGAGTGKSHTIKAIYNMIKRSLKLYGDNPDAIYVLKLPQQEPLLTISMEQLFTRPSPYRFNQLNIYLFHRKNLRI